MMTREKRVPLSRALYPVAVDSSILFKIRICERTRADVREGGSRVSPFFRTRTRTKFAGINVADWG